MLLDVAPQDIVRLGRNQHLIGICRGSMGTPCVRQSGPLLMNGACLRIAQMCTCTAHEVLVNKVSMLVACAAVGQKLQAGGGCVALLLNFGGTEFVSLECLTDDDRYA